MRFVSIFLLKLCSSSLAQSMHIKLALAAADWGGLRVNCPGELNPMISPSESSGVADEQACPTCCRDDRVVGPSSTGR